MFNIKSTGKSGHAHTSSAVCLTHVFQWSPVLRGMPCTVSMEAGVWLYKCVAPLQLLRNQHVCNPLSHTLVHTCSSCLDCTHSQSTLFPISLPFVVASLSHFLSYLPPLLSPSVLSLSLIQNRVSMCLCATSALSVMLYKSLKQPYRIVICPVTKYNGALTVSYGRVFWWELKAHASSQFYRWCPKRQEEITVRSFNTL